MEYMGIGQRNHMTQFGSISGISQSHTTLSSIPFAGQEQQQLRRALNVGTA
jgi:hypothetical protein